MPPVLTATRMPRATLPGNAKPGTPVPASAVTQVAAVAGPTRMGLADTGTYFGVVYAVLSRDAGRSWAIASPEFYRAAADGPGATDHLVRAEHGIVIAWGHGGNFVKVTRDLGRSWSVTTVPEGVDRLTVRQHRLVLREYQFRDGGSRLRDISYVSADGGRTWRRQI